MTHRPFILHTFTDRRGVAQTWIVYLQPGWCPFAGRKESEA